MDCIGVPASGSCFFIFRVASGRPGSAGSVLSVRGITGSGARAETDFELVAHMVVRTGPPSEVPVLVNDDAVTVLMDRMTVIRPLGNDISAAGIPLGVSGGGGAC